MCKIKAEKKHNVLDTQGVLKKVGRKKKLCMYLYIFLA